MGASKYWPLKKTSKAEKGNQRNKSSTENVKGNSSGTSSASNHLRASDGSCDDVFTSKKGLLSPLKAWKPTPERIKSPSDRKKKLGSEAPFEKFKNSIMQLKPSLDVRTKSSQQDVKGSSPALKNTSSAVKFKPSLDSKRSAEPPGINKPEIPDLSKKFQSVDRYPSDISRFKYNESVISSPNSSSGLPGKLVVGSPFLSPTSSISLYSTTTNTSIDRTDSLSMELSESGVMSPFGRKFNSRGLFSNVQNQKNGKVESEKSLDEKEHVSVKKLDTVDYPIQNDISKQVQSGRLTKVSTSTSPLSKSELTFDIDEAKNLIVDDTIAEQQRLDSMQTDVQSDSPPSIYPTSQPTVKLTNDNEQTKILYVNDAEKKISEPLQIESQSKISLSTSSFSQCAMPLTPDNDHVKILHVDDEHVQTDAHSPISQSTSLSSKRRKNLHANDLTTDDGLLEFMKIYGHSKKSSYATPLSQSEGKHTYDNDQTKIFYETSINKMLEPIETMGQNQVLTSTSPLSKLVMKSSHDNVPVKKFQDDATSENEILEPMQINVHVQISPASSPLSESTTELSCDDDQAKILYVVDAPKNEMLKLVQTDVDVQTSPSSSPLSQSVMRSDSHSQVLSSNSPLSQPAVALTRDNDIIRNFQLDGAKIENDMLENEKVDDYSRIFLPTSPFYRSTMTLSCDNNRSELVNVNDTTTANKILKPLKIDGHSRISPSNSPLSKLTIKIPQKEPASKPSVDAEITNKALEPIQTDGHMQVSSSTFPSLRSNEKYNYDDGQANLFYIVDSTSKNETSEIENIDDHGYNLASTSPLSQCGVALARENDEMTILHMNDVPTENYMLDTMQTSGQGETEKRMLESMKIDGHSQISPLTSPVSKSSIKLTCNMDSTRNLHADDVDDVTMKNRVRKPVNDDDYHIQISPSTSPLSRSCEKLKHDSDQTKFCNMIDVPTKNEMLKLVQTDGYNEILPSSSYLPPYGVTSTHGNKREKVLCMNDPVVDSEKLKFKQTDGDNQKFSSTSLVPKPTVKLTYDNDEAKSLQLNGAAIENGMQELIKADGHDQIPSSIYVSQSFMSVTDDNDRTKILHVDGASTKNKMSKNFETEGHYQGSPSTTQSPDSNLKLTRDIDEMKILRGDNVSIENKRLESFRSDGHIQKTPSASPFSPPAMIFTLESDQVKNLHLIDSKTKNEMQEFVQTDEHSQISPSVSSISQTAIQCTHDNDPTKILHLLDVAEKNDVSEHVQTHDYNQNSQHSSPLSQSTMKLTHDNDQTKILHVINAGTTNDMLKSDDRVPISSSIFPSSTSTMELAHDDDHAKILHMIERPENEMLESDQTNGHIKFSHLTSHADDDELPESVCTDVANEELYKDIDIRIIGDLEHIDVYDSEYGEATNDINLKSIDVVDINKVDPSIDMHNRNPKKDNQYISEDKDDMNKFKKEKLSGLQSEKDVFENLESRREKVVENDNDTKISVEMKRHAIATSPNFIYNDNYYSVDCDYVDGKTDGFETESGDILNISRVGTLKDKHYENGRKNEQFPPEKDHLAMKSKFRRGRIVKLESENQFSDNIEFRQGRAMKDGDETKTSEGSIRFKKREFGGNTNTTNHDFGYVDGYYSEDSGYGYLENEIVEFNSENDDFVNVRRVDIKGKHHRNLKRGKNCTFEEYDPAYKCNFRRGRTVDMQTHYDIPRWLYFNRGRVLENGTNTCVDRIRLKKREIGDNTDTTSLDSEYTESYYSNDSEYAQSEREFSSKNVDAASINKTNMLQVKHRRNSKKGRQFILEEGIPAYKCRFRSGRIVDLQSNHDVSRRLAFRRVRGIENDDGTRTHVRRRRSKKSEIADNLNTTSNDSEKVVLRHQEMHEKKNELCLFNNVIEETVTMLSKSRKSKVKALVGAFETVISLQDRSPPRITPH